MCAGNRQCSRPLTLLLVRHLKRFPFLPHVSARPEQGDEEARLRAREIGNEAVAHRSTAGVAVDSVLAAVRAALVEKTKPR